MLNTIIAKQLSFVKSHFHLTHQHDAKDQAEAAPKSTVDYIGAVQGIPICFDAKESAVDTFPLQNIHEHQVKFMQAMEEQNGIAFILLYYTHRHEAYYVPLSDIVFFWNRGKNGGRKSFTYDEIDKTLQIPIKNGVFLHFLEQLQLDLLRHADESTGNGN